MSRLDELWLEMLRYESVKLPAEPIVLVCRSSRIRRVLDKGAGYLNGFGGHITVCDAVSDSLEGAVVWQVAAGRITEETDCDHLLHVHGVYGLSEKEQQPFGDYEDYKAEILKHPSWLCMGELLIRTFKSMEQAEAPESVVLKPEMLTGEDGSYMAWKVMHSDEDFFCFDNTYDGRLKELQQAQIRCLDEFDRICREHDIHYFLGGGTLLGAIRHQGIIPWDDDIDVMMLRDDYEHFIQIAAEATGPEFFYQSNRTDPEYHSIFDKIRLNGTVFKTEFSSRFEHMHQGIFIDIFVHDQTSDLKIMQKLHVFATLFARSMVFHKWEGTDMHFYGRMKLLCKLMTVYKNRASMEKLEEIQRRVVTWYHGRKTHYLYDGTGEHLRHGAFPAAWLEYGRTASLNGKTYPVPKEAEKYLAYSYGKDYNRFPAPQKRKAAHPIVELKI